MIAVDMVGIRSRGGARVALDILASLARFAPDLQLRVLASPRETRDFEFDVHPSVIVEERRVEDRSMITRTIWYSGGLERRAEEVGARATLLLNGMGAGQKIPAVAFVQQSLPYSPEALHQLPVTQRMRMKIIGALTIRSCRNAAVVFVQSAWMKQVIADRSGVPIGEIGVARPGTAPFPEFDDPHLVDLVNRVPPADRLLYVGSSAPHKRFKDIVSGIKLLRLRRPNVRLFATVDPSTPGAQEDGVVAVGNLNRGQLRIVFERCPVVVQASSVESATLVPAEAESFGCAVVLPDLPWAREACATAVFFRPRDASDLADQLHRALEIVKPGERQATIIPDPLAGYHSLVRAVAELAVGRAS